ncbi:MAG: adenylyl-sulfate kinase [Pseudomonadota bacterium]
MNLYKEKMNMDKGFCVWLTGLSASGKTTLASLLAGTLLEKGIKVEVLDGEEIRTSLSQELGFSRQDRETHLRRIALVAKLLARNGVGVIAAAITPYQHLRDEAREAIENYVEVFVNCPLEACIERDPKGLYKKALVGELPNFTGIDDPFEIPVRPEIELLTDKETPEESLARILCTLEILEFVPRAPGQGYSPEEVRRIEKQLSDLGYI